MRYWLLTTEYPPFFGGGIATYCYHTARMFTKFGHEVTVFVPHQDMDSQVKVEEQGRIRIVRFKPGERPYYQYLGWVAALSYQFAEIVDHFADVEGPPDIIESQDYLGIAYFLLQKKYTLTSKTPTVPIIITLHTPKFICDLYDRKNIYRLPDFWIGEMERFCIKAADAIISPSRFLLRILDNFIDLPNIPIDVIPHPFDVINIPFLSPLKSRAERIIFFGRLQYLKGVVQLLEYLRCLWDSGHTFRVDLIGGDTFFDIEGKMMSEYVTQKFSQYFEKGLVFWHGKIHPDELLPLFSNARIGIVPSLFESYSYSVIELMAHGVPVLASDSGGQAEIIEDGKSGFLFSHKQPESFQQKLLKALSLSPAEVQHIMEAARKRVVEVCAYENIYSQKMCFIDDVIKNKHCHKVFPFIRDISVANTELTCEIDESHGTEPDLLSIVIPYYNAGETLKETVQSVFQTTYPKKEVIIVNDGSDDPYSLAVLYQVAQEYPVKIIHKKNEGLAKARNDGAKHARGEFLAFLDADDMVYPEYYGLAIKILKTYNNVSFVGCWTEYFGAAHGVWPTWNPEPPFLLVHNTVNSSGLVFRRKDFLAFGRNDPEMIYGLEDYETVVRMVSKGCRGVAIPLALFKYRVRPASMFRQINRTKMIYLYQLIANKNRDFFNQYGAEVINLLNANGPGYLYDNPTWELPSVGFVAGGTGTPARVQDWSDASSPPAEVKQALTVLWSSPLFRKFLKMFFRLRLHKIFLLKRENHR
ncbi:MAG: glycosyltransferase [Thermosphaera sp.]